MSDDDLGEELTVVWEVEPGREIVPATQLPQVTETNWDDPQASARSWMPSDKRTAAGQRCPPSRPGSAGG